jgi:hypothetical protein
MLTSLVTPPTVGANPGIVQFSSLPTLNQPEQNDDTQYNVGERHRRVRASPYYICQEQHDGRDVAQEIRPLANFLFHRLTYRDQSAELS